MKQITLSIKMLLKDRRSNLYYLLTLAIVSMTSFIFGNLNRNPNLKVAMEINQFGNYIPRYSGFITIIIIGFSLFFSCICIFVFINQKIKDITTLEIQCWIK